MAQDTRLHMAASYMQDIHRALTAMADMLHLAVKGLEPVMLSGELQTAGIVAHTLARVHLHTLQELCLARNREEHQ
jgi:hypothetical protein